jgi:hypothetical protein
MPDLIDVVSTARYLYAPNTLPLIQLLLKSNVSRLTALFSFQTMQSGADINVFQITASAGELEGIPVLHLGIEQNAINLQVAGIKHDLDKVYERLRAFLIEIDAKKRFEKPHTFTTTYQTQSTVRLQVPFERLVSPELWRFVQAQRKLFEPEHTSAEINLSNLSFQVKYITQTPEFIYFPKQLTIEPRSGTNPRDQVYFVLTPTDSEAHQKLIAEFERALGRLDALTTAKKKHP